MNPEAFKRDPRRFRLVREDDPTGVSGEGVVAVGVEFPSGAVVMEWLNDENEDVSVDTNGLAIKPGPSGVADTEEIHGHGGASRLSFIDPSRKVREGDFLKCPECGSEFPRHALNFEESGDDHPRNCPVCGEQVLPEGGEPDDDYHVLRDLTLDSVSLVPAEEVEGFPGGVVEEVDPEP